MALDSPALAGRLKQHARRSIYERRAVISVRPRLLSDVRPKAAKPVLQAPKPKQQSQSVIRHAAVSPAPRTSRSQVLKREAVQRTIRRNRKRHHSRKLGGKALTALAVILFIFGIGVGVNGLRQDQKVAARVQEISDKVDDGSADDAQTGDVPSENKPEDVANYRVAPTLPRKLSVEKLGIEARILRLGVTVDNQFKAPANIYDTGWFEGSAKPGELGAVLLDGHVHGPTQPGVFVGLKKLQKGDKISLERGDGKIFTYSVVTSKTYAADKVDMGAALSSIAPGKPGLNLITCTGEIDKQTNHYKDRLIVFAVQD